MPDWFSSVVILSECLSHTGPSPRRSLFVSCSFLSHVNVRSYITIPQTKNSFHHRRYRSKGRSRCPVTLRFVGDGFEAPDSAFFGRRHLVLFGKRG